MTKEKVSLPVDLVELVMARQNRNMRNSSIKIDENLNIITGNDATDGNIYSIIVKKIDKSRKLTGSAKSLKECSGKIGCDFAQCAEKALGKISPNLQNICSSTIDK